MHSRVRLLRPWLPGVGYIAISALNSAVDVSALSRFRITCCGFGSPLLLFKNTNPKKFRGFGGVSPHSLKNAVNRCCRAPNLPQRLLSSLSALSLERCLLTFTFLLALLFIQHTRVKTSFGKRLSQPLQAPPGKRLLTSVRVGEDYGQRTCNT